MTSKLSKIFFLELEKLIKEAEIISLGLNPHEKDYVPKSTTTINNGYVNIYTEDEGDKYIKWNGKIKDLFKKHSIKNILPDNFFIGLKIKRDLYRNNEQKVTSQKYRKELNSELLRQTEILREIFKNLFIIEDKILIKINKEKKEVIREKNKKIYKATFRRVKGINKRFEYLVKIAQNSKTGAKELSNKTYQNISAEITKINEKLNIALELKKNLIKNDRNSGYEIDESYEIGFI